MQPTIKLVRWGTAYVRKRQIHINQDLLNHPQIYNKVLTHELKHLRGEKRVDWDEPWDWEIFLWKLTHPAAWADMLPVWWHGGRTFSIDWNRMTFWAGIAIGFVCLYTIKRFFT